MDSFKQYISDNQGGSPPLKVLDEAGNISRVVKMMCIETGKSQKEVIEEILEQYSKAKGNA